MYGYSSRELNLSKKEICVEDMGSDEDAAEIAWTSRRPKWRYLASTSTSKPEVVSDIIKRVHTYYIKGAP